MINGFFKKALTRAVCLELPSGREGLRWKAARRSLGRAVRRSRGPTISGGDPGTEARPLKVYNAKVVNDTISY